MRLSTRLSVVASAALALCFVGLAAALLQITSSSLRAYFEGDIRYKATLLRQMVAEKEQRAMSAASWFESSRRWTKTVFHRNQHG